MRYTVLLIGWCVLTSSFAAQKDTLGKYGQIITQELQLISYELDTSAEVVLLYEKGNVEFKSASKIIFSYYARYKIIKPESTNAVFKIPYSTGNGFIKEEIKELKGNAYNLENGVMVTTPLTKQGIKDERLPDDTYEKKITIPSLKKGTVFEYSYTKEIPFLLDHNPPVWYFQKAIPVKWSEFTIVIPTFLIYKNIHEGYLSYYINTKEPACTNYFIGLDNQANKYRFVVKDAPAFRETDFSTIGKNAISSTAFYLTRIAFPHKEERSYINTWEKITDDCLKHFESYLNETRYLSHIADQLTLLPDSMQQIHAAFKYISKKMNWDGQFVSCLPVQKVENIMDAKQASAPEINLMLINLLRQLGFKADPVIISTRDNGKINDSLPLFHQFNYTIANVNCAGKNIVMDATDFLTMPGLLPEHCLNGKGLLIKKNGGRFISLDPREKKADLELMKVKLDVKTGVISGTSVLSADGYSALEKRTLLKEQDEEGLISKLKSEHPLYSYSNFEFDNEEELSQELKIYYDFKYKAVDVSGTIQFHPLFYGRIEKNPFEKMNRIYPVDLKQRCDHVFKSIINIPKGYFLETLPQSTIIELPDSLGKFTYFINVVDNNIQVSSRIMLNAFYFPPEKYWILQNFYDMIIHKQSEQVVLQRE